MRRPSEVDVGFFPTPLHPLPRLSAFLGGPELWVKRDDHTGLATGGNKTRKLRFLLAEARAQGADVLITGGAIQSNHARQTAAAAAQLGWECHLVLRGTPPDIPTGNVLLDYLFGAHVHWVTTREAMHARMEALADELRRAGRRPYLIPYGGANALGTVAYALAVEELRAQSEGRPFDALVVASSSGSTQAGLVAGVRVFAYPTEVVGISVDEPQNVLVPRIARLIQGVSDVLDVPITVALDEIVVEDRFIGEGYARVGTLEREAIRLLARLEGLLLDPVYTARAFGGLVQLIREGRWRRGQRVLFWHTGGIPALWAFLPELVEALR